MKTDKAKISKRTILNIALFAMLCFFATFCIIISQEYRVQTESVDYLQFTGNYATNGSSTYYRLPEDITQLNIKDAGSIEFNLKLTKDIPRGERINILVDKVIIKIFCNNELLHTLGDKSTTPGVVRSVDKCWMSFTSDGLKNGDTLTFQITSCYNKIDNSYVNKFLSNLSVGSYYNLLKAETEKDFWAILGSALAFIIGFLLLIMMLTFRLMKTPFDISSLPCCLLIMCGALSLFLNSSFTSLIFENAFLVTMARYIVQLFVPLFFLMYVKRFIYNSRVMGTLNVLITIWSAVIISFFIFQSSGVLDYYQFSGFILNAVAIIMASTFIFIIVDFKKNNHRDTRTLLSSSIILCACITAELIYKINYGEFLSVVFELGLLIFAVLQFLVIMIVSRRNYVQASKTQEIENELVQSKISVMLSQIQPHFLYNTLVVIRQLCEIDPKTAKEAVTEFANYLRGNLDSLTLNSTIPFEKEMEHVENYVSLEKKRFGDKINIEYDIDVIDFKVPSLTIQTVVENAIRHGISKRKKGGTVTIRTREEENKYTVEVLDDGVGVDLTQPPTQQKDSRSHIGVENSRKRIEAMCGGTLSFSSTPNIGTSVFITIPKYNNKTD